MVIFSLGSLLCALSPTMASLTGWPAINWLIGFRAFQAIGAAALNPVSLAIIIAVFPRERRGATIGVWGALSGLAAAAGPVLGGFLVQNSDWRWIFFVNLPFCIVGLIMVGIFVPETRELGSSKKLDPLGLLTLSTAIFCPVLAIIQGRDWGWTSTVAENMSRLINLSQGTAIRKTKHVFLGESGMQGHRFNPAIDEHLSSLEAPPQGCWRNRSASPEPV